MCEEHIWERLVRAVEEGSKRPSKSLKSSKLRRTSTLTFSKTGLKLPTEKQLLHLSLGAIEYATNTNKKILLHIQNKSNYIYLWWKEKGTALFLLNVQSKSADFCCFHRHIENEATTMQRNRSAHTAWAALVWSTLCIKATLFPQRQQGRNDSDRFLGLQLECQHVPMFLFTAQKYYLNIPVLRVPCWWQE